MRSVDLETLREAFSDARRWIAVGQITLLDLAKDSHALRVKVSLLPEQKVCVADMAWSHCGPGSGFVAFPAIGDLVVVAFADGEHEHGFVVARLSSQADKIPLRATQGHLVAKSNPGSHADLESDTQANVVGPRINLGKTATSPVSPLVLGDAMKDCLTQLFSKLDALLGKLQNDPLVICSAPGQPGLAHPTLKSDLASIQSDLASAKSTFVDTASTNILSQIAFTERGP